MKRKIDRVAPKAREYIEEVLAYGFHNTTSVGVSARLEALFAKRFGVRYAMAHANGTVTMHSALAACGVGAGDEVIVPPLTAGATGLVVLHANAVPVFADIDPETFTIDPADVRRKVTARTRAIIPVAIYGLSPDLDPIMEIAREHRLMVIEDNAQCYLGKYKGRTVGSIGQFASFSFQSSKHMTCGDGGILISDDEALATAARRVSSFGYASVSAKPGAATMPEAERCSPLARRHITMGYNFRLPEIAAAVALAELERLDELVAMRTACADLFSKAVTGCPWIVPQKTPAGYIHAWWTYVFRIADSGPDWAAFRRRFVEAGGDGFYGAWRPTYREPVFETLSADVAARPGRYPHLAGVMPDYRAVSCPVTERVQPRLVHMKTNYFDLDEAERQAEILARTIRRFA
jgi:perosamine synthetase